MFVWKLGVCMETRCLYGNYMFVWKLYVCMVTICVYGNYICLYGN